MRSNCRIVCAKNSFCGRIFPSGLTPSITVPASQLTRRLTSLRPPQTSTAMPRRRDDLVGDRTSARINFQDLECVGWQPCLCLPTSKQASAVLHNMDARQRHQPANPTTLMLEYTSYLRNDAAEMIGQSTSSEMIILDAYRFLAREAVATTHDSRYYSDYL